MRLRRKRLALWLLAIALSASFVSVSVGTAVNYVQVAETKLLVYADVAVVPEMGRGPNGSMNSIRFDVTASVTDPGGRGVSMWLAVVKVWLRDYETEGGVATGRNGMDAATVEDRATKLWTPILVLTSTIAGDVGAGQSRNFSWATDPIGRNTPAFGWVGNISSYAKAHSLVGGDARLEWRRFARLTMYVSGVPRDVPGYGTYLADTPKIERSVGVDIDGRGAA